MQTHRWFNLLFRAFTGMHLVRDVITLIWFGILWAPSLWNRSFFNLGNVFLVSLIFNSLLCFLSLRSFHLMTLGLPSSSVSFSLTYLLFLSLLYNVLGLSLGLSSRSLIQPLALFIRYSAHSLFFFPLSSLSLRILTGIKKKYFPYVSELCFF